MPVTLRSANQQNVDETGSVGTSAASDSPSVGPDVGVELKENTDAGSGQPDVGLHMTNSSTNAASAGSAPPNSASAEPFQQRSNVGDRPETPRQGVRLDQGTHRSSGSTGSPVDIGRSDDHKQPELPVLAGNAGDSSSARIHSVNSASSGYGNDGSGQGSDASSGSQESFTSNLNTDDINISRLFTPNHSKNRLKATLGGFWSGLP